MVNEWGKSYKERATSAQKKMNKRTGGMSERQRDKSAKVDATPKTDKHG